MKPEITYSLIDLAHPTSQISSTAALSFTSAGTQPHSFSMPPFLFYAMKAKALANLGIADEQAAALQTDFEIRDSILSDIREIAKSVTRDIHAQNMDFEHNLSSMIQSRLLHVILGDGGADHSLTMDHAAVPINASRSGKNVTVLAYLFKRLSDLLGSDKLAKLQIHEMMVTIRDQLANANMLSPSGDLVGPAKNSSWSRKLHNHIFLELIKVSNLKELRTTPSMLEIRLKRDPRLETQVRSGKLKVS